MKILLSDLLKISFVTYLVISSALLTCAALCVNKDPKICVLDEFISTIFLKKKSSSSNLVEETLEIKLRQLATVRAIIAMNTKAISWIRPKIFLLLLSRSIKLWNAVYIMSSTGSIT